MWQIRVTVLVAETEEEVVIWQIHALTVRKTIAIFLFERSPRTRGILTIIVKSIWIRRTLVATEEILVGMAMVKVLLRMATTKATMIGIIKRRSWLVLSTSGRSGNRKDCTWLMVSSCFIATPVVTIKHMVTTLIQSGEITMVLLWIFAKPILW